MSLMSSSVHSDTVTVVLRTTTRGTRGEVTYSEVGRVLCTGMVQELTSTDVEAYGQSGAQVMHMKRFTCYEFPGDDISQIITADGVVWEVVGTPKRFRTSRRTKRDVVVMSAQKQQRQWA